MSLYGNSITIDGITAGLVMRGGMNGYYLVVFEREFASIEQIEGINWAKPTIEGDCILPTGYGYELVNIDYKSATKSYTATVKVAEQYLGDVEGYQTQVAELEETITQKDAEISTKTSEIQSLNQTIEQKDQELAAKDQEITSKTQEIAELEAAGTAAQVEEQLAAAYKEGVESNG